MSDITRTKVLEILEHNWTSLHNPDYTDEELGKALDFCISSLETDEAYDLMYEQPEFYEDCISRKNILESLNGAFASTDWNKALFRKIVMDSPSVLPKATKNDLVVDAAVVPFGDAISRQEAIDTIRQLYLDLASQKAVIDILKVLPSITPQLSSRLENIATTKNNLGVDAVSREAVTELVSSQRLDTFSDEGRKWANIKIDVILRGLKELPSVTPQEPKTGHWIEVTNGRGGHECDVCHSYAPSFQSGDEYLSPFCPNCGAKMVEPQEVRDKE